MKITNNPFKRGFPLAVLCVWSGWLWLAGGSPVESPVPIAAQAMVPSTTVKCPPLPPPPGAVVTASSVAELVSAVNNAEPGTTILVADGYYALDGSYLRIDTPGVTLRSASGDREAVVLDGNYHTTEIVQIVASNVTIADLTLQRAYDHPIHVTSSDAGATLNTRIYNVQIIDPGQQAIKINPHAARVYFPDDGEVACSRLTLTDAGREHIRDSCYTGGVDGHQARGWVVRDNVIEGFWCDSGLSEHAVHFWTGSRDTLVERNRLIDNARGVGFGLLASGDGRSYPDDPCPGADYVDHYGGVIRNNMISAGRDALFASRYGFDCGICLWQACGASAIHNSVVSTQLPFSSIEWRFDATDVEIINNLVSHNLRDRGGRAQLAGNLVDAPLALFLDGAGGDLHLVATADQAIDGGISLAPGLCDDDFDSDLRPIGDAPDIGADEYFRVVLDEEIFLPLLQRY
jgi:hypothetical protein